MKTSGSSNNILFFILAHIFLLVLLLTSHGRNFASAASVTAPVGGRGGKWDLLLSNIGITAMHMQLLNNDRVVIYDRTDFGMSNISLPYGKCRYDQNDTTLKVDCTAHSVEYDVASNTIRPLMVQTDVWCSSGSVVPDGSLVQTGGFNDGEKVVRVLKPCSSATTSCDWQEIPGALIQRRWYATNHILPDGRQIVIGGRRTFNYEFIPKTTWAHNAYSLPFLVETNDRGVENNLYPFVFLNVDGNLFIFANNRAILFDYTKNVVVKTYPEIPGGDPRNYPSTGSAVLLPLNLQAQNQEVQAEVLLCGGAPKGSFISAQNNGTFLGAFNTCGRIRITDPDPKWTMETMPLARTMGDMIILPNGNVLIINGAANGTAGWEFGRDPVLNPVIYRPDNPLGSRFEIQNPSPIPRMYHSTAVLLRDGRVLVGGSNPHIYYNFTGVTFPTELRLEAFSPAYLDPSSDYLRPRIMSHAPQYTIGYGQRVPVRFTVSGWVDRNLVKVSMVAPGFNTHSFTMNQRLLVLASENVKQVGIKDYQINVVTPNNAKVAPPGYYLLFVVHQDIPSEGIWVKIQ